MGKTPAIDHDLLSGFIEDSLDTLKGFERSTVALRAPDHVEALEELFRAAHNLKGAAMCMGLDAVGEFVHSIEDVIQSIIDGKAKPNEQVIATLLQASESLSSWVRVLISDLDYVPPVALLKEELRAISGQPPSELSALPSEESQVPDHETVDIQELFEFHRKLYKQERERRNSTGVLPELDGRSHASSHAAEVDKGDEAQLDRRAPVTGSRQRGQENVRIPQRKLDELIRLVGELSIHQGVLFESAKHERHLPPEVRTAIDSSQKLLREIHSVTLELQMQPISSLMEKLERTALDLAASQSKLVNIVVEGAEVHLDKSVLEKVSDPFLHIMRNAVDHGIELPSERIAKGKPARATLKISATQSAGGVLLTVSDDGRGMDERAIFAAAARKGIVNSDDQLTPDQIYRLIFVQGISTAPKVTEVSGRGVGMDVVLRTIHALHGGIDIKSELGKGTTFFITLPTSVSIIEALVITVKNTRYAVPLKDLTEVIDLGGFTCEAAGHGGKMISLRGEVVPVEALADYMPTRTDARAVLALEKAADGAQHRPALVIREGEKTIAFSIDQVVTQQQVVIRPLLDQLSGLSGVRGCTILGDGEPGIILSMPEVARMYITSLLNEDEQPHD